MDIEKLVIPEIREPGTYVVEFVGIENTVVMGLNVLWRIAEEPFKGAIVVQVVLDDRAAQTGRISRRKRLGQLASVISGHDESPEINLGAYVGSRFRLTIVDRPSELDKKIGSKNLVITKVEPLRINKTS